VLCVVYCVLLEELIWMCMLPYDFIVLAST